jgi:lipopolysaccharide biosynthesis glycosyltransferase
MIPVVTAADAGYFAGVVALYKSFLLNAGPGFEFYAMLYGEDVQAAGIELGMNVIVPPVWESRFPTTEKWPEPSEPMYARLLVPMLFQNRAIWIDADCVILEPLAPLALMDFRQPLAAVHFKNERYRLGFHIPNIEEHLADIPCPFTGLIVFNVPAWRDARITEKCVEWMNSEADYDFRFVVQSVLGLVLEGDYHHLPQCWQVFANRKDLPEDARILHWVGALPWRDEMPNTDIWRRYYESAEA